MGRPISHTSLHTPHLVARAAARAERAILGQSLADIVPQLYDGVLAVEIGLVIGANGGLREIEIGEVRRATARMTVSLPIGVLAPGRIAPVLVDAITEVLNEVRAAA